jgi:proprotein convertase subtilisin/kexin type 5
MYLMSDGSCSASCQDRYFPSTMTHTCRPCPYDCLTCDSAGLCLTCASSDFRVFNNDTSRCAPMLGYYDIKQTICSACPVGCATCQSLTLCISCLTNYYLNNLDKLCSSSCPQRTYANPSTLTCISCPYDCLTCDATGLCLSCAASDLRVMAVVTQRCIPKVGFFENANRTVEQCPPGCKTCISLSNCSSCLTGFTLLTNSATCSSQCSIRQYFNSSSSLCLTCPYDCLMCDSNLDCLSCSATDYRQLNLTTLRC